LIVHRLFTKQLAKADRGNGEIDVAVLGQLVSAAYEEAERDRARTERSIRLMADELEQVHRRLLDAFEVVPEGLVLLDAERRYVLWNQRYAEIYDAVKDKIAVGARFAATLQAAVERGVYPEAIGREDQWLAERLDRNVKTDSTHEQQLAGNRWIRVDERRTADGGSIGIRTDITDLKRREESFRLLFEDNPIPMLVWAGDDAESARVVSVNSAAIAHYGYSREQFAAMSVIDMRPPEDRAAFRKFLSSGRQAQGNEIWRHIKADGAVIQVQIYTRMVTHQGRRARLNAIIDVTERQRAKELLIAQKAQTDAAIANMSQGLVMFDKDARLVLCNRQYIDMYRLSPDVVKPGCTLIELLRHRKAVGMFGAEDPETYSRKIMETAERGESMAMTITLPDGRNIHITTSPMIGGGWVSTQEDVTERTLAQARIKFLADHDSLTGLSNRAAFNEFLTVAVDDCARRESQLAVISVDFDRFKEINDVFGHPVGDAVLRDMAIRLQSAAGDAFVARLGGDEFSIVQTQGEQPAATEELAARLMAATTPPIEVNGHLLRTALSIGAAIYPTDGGDPQTLLANADAALYRAKQEGRGSVRFFEREMDQRLRERRALQQDLRAAIESNQLELHYQPQATLDRRIVGFEALARWSHPQLGRVAPDLFIPLAEESGLIIELGEWILRTACDEAASWQSPKTIAVNLSPAQFKHGDLVATVHSALLDSGLAPHRLELEITEGVLIGDFSRAVAILHKMKSLGVRIAMDDFGTGYSSLSYLQSFPFDKIKIDRSFIMKLTRDSKSATIVRTIISLGKGLSLPITAEGVETEEQLTLLREEGCDEVQGYLVGKPLPIAQYEAVVSGHADTPALPVQRALARSDAA
jgi:diguanylate cyclase (GGDEF)-like protein/PAS domain S-box-containing protein